jgi:hypothetical protein
VASPVTANGVGTGAMMLFTVKLSALYLSIKRLREVIGQPGGDEGIDCVTQISTVDLQRVRNVHYWEQQTVRLLETKTVPSLEHLLTTKTLTDGIFFRYADSFIAQGIIDAAARFGAGKVF